MFELHIQDTNINSGSIPISWCLNKEHLDQIIKTNNPNPVIVICTSPVNNYHKSKELRQVVPLRNLMSYVTFNCSGENKIWGFISYKSEKDAKNFYLYKTGGEYHEDILYYTGHGYASWLENSSSSTDLSEAITVNVPKEYFAKEPSPALKTYANHFFLISWLINVTFAGDYFLPLLYSR